MRAITRIVSAAAAAALALTLTACSSSDDKTSDDPKPAGTGQATPADDKPADDDKGSAGSLSAENFYEVLAASVKEGTSYRLSMSTSAAGTESTSEGEVVISDAGPAMSMTTTAAGVEMAIVMVDDAYYMNMGDLTQNKFMKIDLNDPSNPLGASMGSFKDLSDPSKSLEMFKDSVTSVEKVGEEDVEGTSATHYVVTLDSSAVGDALAGVDPSAMPSLPAEFTYDFWVDGDNRPVKMTSEVMGATTEIVYSDWNDSSISVEAPSADQISDLDFSELMGGAATQG